MITFVLIALLITTCYFLSVHQHGHGKKSLEIYILINVIFFCQWRISVSIHPWTDDWGGNTTTVDWVWENGRKRRYESAFAKMCPNPNHVSSAPITIALSLWHKTKAPPINRKVPFCPFGNAAPIQHTKNIRKQFGKELQTKSTSYIRWISYKAYILYVGRS